MIKNPHISLDQTVIQVKGNIVSDMGGEKVMLSVKKGKYFNLGVIGGHIWELIEEEIEVSKLVAQLREHYDIDQATCEDQVVSFLDLLLKEELIEVV